MANMAGIGDFLKRLPVTSEGVRNGPPAVNSAQSGAPTEPTRVARKGWKSACPSLPFALRPLFVDCIEKLHFRIDQTQSALQGPSRCACENRPQSTISGLLRAGPGGKIRGQRSSSLLDNYQERTAPACFSRRPAMVRRRSYAEFRMISRASRRSTELLFAPSDIPCIRRSKLRVASRSTSCATVVSEGHAY
jgi:hypothetical protein